MSVQYPSIILSDLPCGPAVAIYMDLNKDPRPPPGDKCGRSLEPGIREIASRMEDALKRTNPVDGVRRVTSRIEEIFERTRPIDSPRERYTSPIDTGEHQTKMIRRRLKDGDCIPEELAQVRPFHIYHNDDGSLELYWLVNNRLNRVG